MPLFEIETDSHIIITWAADEPAAREVVMQAYPTDNVIRLTKRPRDTWVISKGVLGITSRSMDVCGVARDCLAKSSGTRFTLFDVHARNRQRFGESATCDRKQHGDGLVSSKQV